MERAIRPASVLSHPTWPRCNAVTAMSTATCRSSAPSPSIVSPSGFWRMAKAATRLMLTDNTESRVKCANSQEMGHFKSKCPNEHDYEDAGGYDGGSGGGDAGHSNDSGGGCDWNNVNSSWGGSGEAAAGNGGW